MNTPHAVIQALRSLGATHATASFSGGNDEGGYDGDICFYNGDTELDGSIDAYEAAYSEAYTPTAKTIAEYFNGVLEGEYGGFGGDFHVHGTVTVTTDGETTLKGQQSSQNYDDFERSY